MSKFAVSTVAMATILTLWCAGTAHAENAPGVLQSAAHTANITGTVVRADATPITGAKVQLIGPAVLGTTTDAHGTFAFISVPFGIYLVVVASPELGQIERPNTLIASDVNLVIQYQGRASAGGLKIIAHTTSHINATAANVASVTPQDYAFQGNASWKQLVDTIPGVAASGGLGGGGSGLGSIAGSPIQPIILSINGTQPYETSTMIDGMPLQSGSLAGGFTVVGGSVDLGFLPLNGFPAADVVRGPGGDSPSIVNSVGGTFVLHAPTPVQDDALEFSASNDPYGGIISNLRGAVKLGRLSATAVYGVNDSPGPLGNTAVTTAYVQQPLTIGGKTFQSCYSPANLTLQSCTGLSQTAYPEYSQCNCVLQNSLEYCCVPQTTEWSQHSESASISYRIGDGLTAEVFYSGQLSNMAIPLYYWPVEFYAGPGYSGSLKPGTHSFIGATTPGPYYQASRMLEEKLTAKLGSGVFRVSAVQLTTNYNLSIPSLMPDGYYTVWGSGYVGDSKPGTYTTFNGSRDFLTFSPIWAIEQNTVNNRDLLFSYSSQVGPSSTMGISYLSSYYDNPYSYSSGPAPYTFTLNGPSDQSETTGEFRAFASSDISPKLSVTGSWYFAEGSYHVQNPADPTGKTWADSIFQYNAPRLAAVWRPNSSSAIRFAAGGGFALPQRNILSGYNTPLTPGQINYVYQPNLHLQPETSFGIDLGSDVRLRNGSTIALDLYRTNLFGQFYQNTQYGGQFAGLPYYVTQYRNLARSRFEGVNLDIKQASSNGLYWHAGLGLTRGYVVDVPPGFYDQPGKSCNFKTGSNCTNIYVVPGANFNGQYDATVPYANGSAQLGYSWRSRVHFDVTANYYGNNNPYLYPGFLEFDAHAGIDLTKNFSLLVAGNNLSNIHGQSYQVFAPSTGAPAIVGKPFAQEGMPYGPRALIITINAKT